MKKLLIAIAASLAIITTIKAQPTFTVLDELDDTTYNDIKVLSPTYLAGLRYSFSGYIDLRTNTGNSFGTTVRTIPIGDTNTYFTKIAVVGNYVYAYGYDLQAIDLSNPASPVYGPVISLGSPMELRHSGTMLYMMAETFTGSLITAFSIANPLNPVQVGILNVPQSGSFNIWQNKLFYAQSNDTFGNRVLTYTLSNTAPYFTPDPVFTIGPSVQFYIPETDVIGNHLLVNTADTLYDLGINTNGSLQINRKRLSAAGYAFKIVANDTNTLCYASYRQIDAQSLSNGASITVDTTDRMSFNSMVDLGRLGNNIYYSSLGMMRLIRFGNAPSSVNNISHQDDRFHIYPNPTSQQWTVESKSSATFTLYASDGKLVHTQALQANHKQTITAKQLATGNYFYRIIAADGVVSTGKLLKNE